MIYLNHKYYQIKNYFVEHAANKHHARIRSGSSHDRCSRSRTKSACQVDKVKFGICNRFLKRGMVNEANEPICSIEPVDQLMNTVNEQTDVIAQRPFHFMEVQQ